MRSGRTAFALSGLFLCFFACSTAPNPGTSTSTSSGTGGKGGDGGADGGVCEAIYYAELCGVCADCLREKCCDLYIRCIKSTVCLTCLLGYPLDPNMVDCTKDKLPLELSACSAACPAPFCHTGELPPCFDGGTANTGSSGNNGGGGAGGNPK